MKIETLLDYETILANRATPVHLALRFIAPEVTGDRTRPIAFCLVIDRSGSMAGRPLEAAKEAARLVVRNLRKNDLFALVVFDHEARVAVPLQSASSRRQTLLNLIDSIRDGGSTNLTSGWTLGRDELKKAPADLPRRLLLLSDGLLNVGITEPEAVRNIVSSGFERDQIATSCLGFGDHYNEDLLASLASATNASFYDANLPDKLPEIFSAELEGLQALAIQNLRIRLKRLEFCDSLELFGDYPVTETPDGLAEIAVGHLISDEERTLIVALEVPPIPLVEGKPAADLTGERLVEVEVLFDAIKPDELVSHQWNQVVRIQPVQNAADLRTNVDVIGLVSTQQVGKTLELAIREVDAGRLDSAKVHLRQAIERLKAYPPSIETIDGIRTLENFLLRLEAEGEWTRRERKSARYHSQFLRKMSSSELWTSVESPPAFSKKRPRESGQPPSSDPDGSKS